jgi:hypothetical protein
VQEAVPALCIIANMPATADMPAIASARAVTARERYLFDLQGFLVVPDALGAGQLAALNALMDERIAAEVPANASRHRFIEPSLLTWGQPFIDLIDHAPVMPYLREFVGGGLRLDHDYADLIRSGHSPIGASLHGGGAEHDDSCYYVHRNGRIHSGLTVVAYNLHDVDPGDGGFGCVPGSHKANHPLPAEWMGLDEPAPCVRAVTGRAGTAIIFTEALTHGALPWLGPRERRTVFFKYSPPTVSWFASYYDHRAFPALTPAQRDLLEAPNARYGYRPKP